MLLGAIFGNIAPTLMLNFSAYQLVDNELHIVVDFIHSLGWG